MIGDMTFFPTATVMKFLYDVQAVERITTGRDAGSRPTLAAGAGQPKVAYKKAAQKRIFRN
ncbi:MAG: hypothetical protein AB8B55_12705 [Mariniblastus sp.]